ncbi:MAG: cytochrome-c peroxidase [Chitinophagaceae bacterium]|nr:cytochrome-c peroxidase [Chitinophagaceae bacterium]
MKRVSLLAISLFLSSAGLMWNPAGWTIFPTDFPKPTYEFLSNPYNPKLLTLGRMLFYDPRLSADSTISCASCHSPYNAFAHTDHALSHGIHDSIGFRNAPALFNLAWQKSMMWDGAIHHLDVQALAPLQASNEMGKPFKTLAQQLNRDVWYRQLFKEAMHIDSIHGKDILNALAQFQLSLVSNQSRYDSMRRKQIQFTYQEKTGYALFKQHCNTCHQEPLFSTYNLARNGLPIDSQLNDKGRMRLSEKKEDSLLFKIPSLRNLSYTFPYMHDGRYKNLRMVLQHYANNKAIIGNGPALSAGEQTDLLAFLLTLNDRHFVFDTTHTFPQELRKQLE